MKVIELIVVGICVAPFLLGLLLLAISLVWKACRLD